MIVEPKFKVSLEKREFKIESLNKEANDLQEEFNSFFPTETILKFILLAPNSMDMDKDGNLIYEVSLSFKEEIFNQLKGL